MSRIELEIEELVLHGLDPQAAQAFVAALRQEIARALVDPAARAALSAREDLELSVVSMALPAPQSAPAALGRAAGEAVTRQVLP